VTYTFFAFLDRQYVCIYVPVFQTKKSFFHNL